MLKTLALWPTVFIFSTATSLFHVAAVPEAVANFQRFQPTSGPFDDELGFYPPGIRPEEILRGRGYKAEIHYFISDDDYQLELVRGINPLLENNRSRPAKLPILFIHGVFVSHASWLVNSRYVKPRLYDDRYDLSTMTSAQVYELTRDDPARHSLPFLAMNFGYEVWLLSRRGYTPGSRYLVSRPQRTLADALASIPGTLLDGAPITFGAGLRPGRPNRVSIESVAKRRIDARNVSGPLTNVPPRTDLVSLPVESLAQWLQTLAKLPEVVNSLDDKTQQFIDNFDPEFWNFSIDEQVQYDFPGAIDFVLARTRQRQLHLVSYSLGGAITLLGLASQPELAEKVSRCVLYAPALNLGSRDGIDYLLSYLNRVVQSITAPLPPIFLQDPIRASIQQICNNNATQRTLCEFVSNLIVGFSAGQEPLTQAIISDVFAITGTRELLQLGQFTRTDVPHRYNFSDPSRNREVYGQSEPPAYDLGAITLRNISIYAGQNDLVVAPNAIATTVTQMRVPVELNLIGGDKRVFFNHLGNLIHERNDQLILIPSLIDIARSEALD